MALYIGLDQTQSLARTRVDKFAKSGFALAIRGLCLRQKKRERKTPAKDVDIGFAST
jgi:hypothetical protein